MTNHPPEHHVRRLDHAEALAQQLPSGALLLELEEPLALDQVPEHRHFACEYYLICLAIASYCAWNSFSCSQCPIWNRKGTSNA